MQIPTDQRSLPQGPPAGPDHHRPGVGDAVAMIWRDEAGPPAAWARVRAAAGQQRPKRLELGFDADAGVTVATKGGTIPASSTTTSVSSPSPTGAATPPACTPAPRPRSPANKPPSTPSAPSPPPRYTACDAADVPVAGKPHLRSAGSPRTETDDAPSGPCTDRVSSAVLSRCCVLYLGPDARWRPLRRVLGAAQVWRTCLRCPRKTAHVQRVERLVNREDFPPDIELEMGRIWKTEKVRRWAETRGRERHERPGRSGRIWAARHCPAEGDLAIETAALLPAIAGRRSSRRWRLLEREWRTNQATCLGWAGVPANPHARGIGACRCRAGLPAAPPRTAAPGLRRRWCLRPAWRAEISIIRPMLPVPGRSAVVGVARTAGCHRVRRVGQSRSSHRRVGGGTGRPAAAPGR